MNKKVFTLVAAFLAAGGSLAFVNGADLKLNLGAKVANNAKISGKYFVVYDADGAGALNAGDFALAQKWNSSKTALENVSTLEIAGSTNNWSISSPEEGLKEDNFVWTVTEITLDGGAGKAYEFKNEATGEYFYINSDKDDVEKTPANFSKSYKQLVFGASGAATAAYAPGKLAVSGDATKALKLTSNAIIYETATSLKNVMLVAVADENVGASAFEDRKGAFTLEYKIGNDAANENIFKDVIAIQVTSQGSSKYPAGTYFVTNAENELSDDKMYDASQAGVEAKLNKLTFIVAEANSTKSWGINALTGNLEDLKFTTIRGSQLVATATAKEGQTSVANANFTVEENLNNPGKVRLSLTPKVYDADNDVFFAQAKVYVAAVPSRGNIYVTTVASNTNANYTYWTTIGSSNIVEAKSFLDSKAALVYNIKFVSKVADGGMNAENQHDKYPNTYSEYSKYLGIAEEGITAQGKDYVDLNAPQNQWLVTDGTTDNKFTFTNRETGESFVAQLVKTSKENEYKLTEVVDPDGDATLFDAFYYAYEAADGSKAYSDSECDLSGTTVLLSKATVNPNAGYVSNELDNVGLVRMSYTTESAINPVELYLTATKSDENVKLNKDASKAALFDVVKFTTDTVYKFTDYAVWNATDKKVDYKEKADTVAVVTYAFKLFGEDKSYLASGLSIDNNINDVEDAQQFIIKKNADGSQSLIEYTVGNDFEDAIKDAKALTADLTDGSIENTISIYADFDSYFSIKAEELGNSWNHVPQHVTFADANIGGYIAVGEGSKAILAPTSELKAEYTKEDLTFWLDTTDTDAHVPAFYISKAGKFMYNAYDSAYYFNDGVATDKPNKDYLLPGSSNARAIFCEGTLKDANTLEVTIDGEKEELTSANGLDNFKFNIIENEDGEYLIRSVAKGTYLYNLNAELGFTGKSAAMPVVVEVAEAPTSNEGVAASEVKVVAQDGAVVVKNAAGKNVVVSTILGQVVANEVLTSDNATINVPAGIVVVAVEGESFKVNVK